MFEFRIISQNGLVDYPYSAGLIIESYTKGNKYRICMPHNGGVMAVAYYETREEAEKVLKDVMEAYKDFIDWVVDRAGNAGKVMPDPFFKMP